MNTLTETTPPLNSPAADGKTPVPLQTVADRIAQEEHEQEEYRQWFSRQVELHLKDPEIIAWLATPVERRPPKPHLPTRMIWQLEMRRTSDCLLRFTELLAAFEADKPTEVLDDEELNPKPSRRPSRRCRPANKNERKVSKRTV